MGTVHAGGVSFRIYSHDHTPPHAHGYYAEVSVVVELIAETVSIRNGSMRPYNAKTSDVRKIVSVAVECYSELMEMWEATHGKA